MASTKSDQNPDKRDRSKPKDYLSDWIKRQSLVEKMIPMIGNLPVSYTHLRAHETS